MPTPTTPRPWDGALFVGGAFVPAEHGRTSTVLDKARAPFGGRGASGLGGRSGGESNLHEFTEPRWLTVQHEPVAYPY